MQVMAYNNGGMGFNERLIVYKEKSVSRLSLSVCAYTRRLANKKV